MISRNAALVQAARGPVLLILLGFLFVLQQDGALAFSRSWPLLIIAIGCMKLVERMIAGPAAYVPPSAGVPPPPPVPPFTPGYTPSGQRPAAGSTPPGRGTI